MRETVQIMAGALFYTAPMQAERRALPLPAPGLGEVRVHTLHSALSRGTERLVASGRVPLGEAARMRCPMQEGEFPFPVKYGYACVGVVEAGPPEWLGASVFVLHPHQDRFICPVGALNRLPAGLPLRRATLAANMETALNAVWDSGVSLADDVVVVGGGLVGLLVAHLCAGIPGARVTLVDVNPARATLAAHFGCAFALPHDAPTGADVVFHTSATPAGLATAMAAAGVEAKVVEMSWYGAGDVPAPLGGAFHSGRISLVSSQVGRVSPGHAARGWTYSSRLQAALRLLQDARLDALLSETVAFAALPAEIPRLLAPAAEGIATVIDYGE